MKIKTIMATMVFLLVTAPCLSAACLSTPIAMRIGIKPGITACNYDPNIDISDDAFSGIGMHVGLGMGADFFRLAGFDLVPQYRTTSFAREELLWRCIRKYNSFMFPMFLSVRGYMIPYVSPYIGLGIGFNIQFSGTERFEFDNGTATEKPLATGLQGFIILGGGAEIKLKKWRIIPEVVVNISGSGDEDNPPETEEKDIDISVGFYYAQ